MSPATVSTSGSCDGLIVRAVATTAQPRPRYSATSPAPMPREPPVMRATFPVMTPPALAAQLQRKRASTSAFLARQDCLPLRSRLGPHDLTREVPGGYPGRQPRAGITVQGRIRL